MGNNSSGVRKCCKPTKPILNQNPNPDSRASSSDTTASLPPPRTVLNRDSVRKILTERFSSTKADLLCANNRSVREKDFDEHELHAFCDRIIKFELKSLYDSIKHGRQDLLDSKNDLKAAEDLLNSTLIDKTCLRERHSALKRLLSAIEQAVPFDSVRAAEVNLDIVRTDEQLIALERNIASAQSTITEISDQACSYAAAVESYNVWATYSRHMHNKLKAYGDMNSCQFVSDCFHKYINPVKPIKPKIVDEQSMPIQSPLMRSSEPDFQPLPPPYEG